MIPTRSKDLLKVVAKELDIPESEVNTIVSFYYKECKKMLENLDHTTVVLRGLGRMVLLGWNIEKEIKKKEAALLTHSNPGKLQKLEEELVILRKALPMWEQKVANKKEVIKRKQEYYKNKEDEQFKGKTTDNLGE